MSLKPIASATLLVVLLSVAAVAAGPTDVRLAEAVMKGDHTDVN